MLREQGMLMDELSQLVNFLEKRSDLTGQHVQAWTMGQYMDHVFPVRPSIASTGISSHRLSMQYDAVDC